LGNNRLISESTLICIPALNEAESIVSTLDRLVVFVPLNNILVIDDGSRDDTASKCKDFGVRTVSLVSNLGVGAAMRAGFIYAKRNGFRRVIQFDADGQHLPEYLESIERELNNFDVVVGSRFRDDDTYRVGLVRSSAMKFLCFTVSKLVGVKLTDVTSGFRGAGSMAIDVFAEGYPTEYLGDTVESLVIAHKSNLSITEVSVKMQARVGGSPSNGPVKSAFSMVRMMGAIGIFVLNNVVGKKS
jgi:glycosyltransferase involved in cell wall biosynthesis